MTLSNDIQQILGVVPAPAPASLPYQPPSNRSDWVPERPVERYLYNVSVYTNRYASTTIEATSKQDARDHVWDHDDWDWDDGDMEINDVDREDDTPVNQDEIDEWDAEYGAKYDADGEPACSDCGNNPQSAADLLPVDNDTRWLCADCLPF